MVHLELHTTPAGDGEWSRTRQVAEIYAIEPGEKEMGYAATAVFAKDPVTGASMPKTLPDRYRSLTGYGFDYAGYLAAQPRPEDLR